jgi:trans-aconitate 2-methyltransferase
MISRLATPDWDAKAYQQFSRLRQRPVNELLDRVDLPNPQRIYDLGCGTGIATQLLAKRWPRAQLQGIDSSAQMLDEAAVSAGERWAYVVCVQADIYCRQGMSAGH